MTYIIRSNYIKDKYAINILIDPLIFFFLGGGGSLLKLTGLLRQHVQFVFKSLQ